MPDLIPPTAASAEPVSLTSRGRGGALRARRRGLPEVPVPTPTSQRLSLRRRRSSPAHPHPTYHRVLDECVIERGAGSYAWTIRSRFVTGRAGAEAGARQDRRAREQHRRRGRDPRHQRRLPVGQGEVPDVRLRHRAHRPSGADMVLKGDADKTHLLAAPSACSPAKHPEFGKYVPAAREVRRLLAARGWKPRGRLPDPQPAPPRARVRARLRARDAAAAPGTTRARVSTRSSADQRGTTCMPTCACGPTRRSSRPAPSARATATPRSGGRAASRSRPASSSSASTSRCSTAARRRR